MISTPHALGYRMPAEWEPHKATWLAWPHDLETWPDQLADVKATYLEIIEHLYLSEEVHILVEDEQAEKSVSRKLCEKGIAKNISIHLIETDSPWIRDYGPLFLHGKQGGLAFSKWNFNAWGRKYSSFEKDNRVPNQIASMVQAQLFQSGIVLEGGSIDVNGSGTCLTTEQCLLNPNRNPKLGRSAIEQKLKDFLGVRHLIWLSEGVVGDDTDGHVDEVARFIAPGTVLASLEKDSHDQNYGPLQRNWQRLHQAVDQVGKPLDVIALPMPEKVEFRGARFPASYANFYIANQSVLVPTYHQKTDAIALGILKDLFPNRNVVGVSAIPLIYGQGTLHCITQQQPAIDE